MPLRDHFHLPVSRLWPWSSIHGAWATFIVQHLNQGRLPSGYYALPSVHLGGQAQIDVATVREEDQALSTNGAGGTATVVWAPPQPPLAVPIEFADPDVFEVRVLAENEGLRLVAAVELVSPANKDRPAHRRAFAAKCAAYLQQGVGLIVLDVVTERQGNLHAELMQLLDLGESAASAAPDLYAVAYRTSGEANAMRLEMWPTPLAVAAPLPVLPLWIAPDQAIPLDFEATYQVACDSLRIR